MPAVSLNAGTIHYENSGPTNGRPLVFVHGYAMGASLWRPLIERLAGGSRAWRRRGPWARTPSR
jgi:pimeloyl-ACP methyl ester carboxylesterase